MSRLLFGAVSYHGNQFSLYYKMEFNTSRSSSHYDDTLFLECSEDTPIIRFDLADYDQVLLFTRRDIVCKDHQYPTRCIMGGSYGLPLDKYLEYVKSTYNIPVQTYAEYRRSKAN